MFNSSIKLLPTKRFNENNTKVNTKLINLITISIIDKRKSIKEEDIAYLGEQEKKGEERSGKCSGGGETQLPSSRFLAAQSC